MNNTIKIITLILAIILFTGCNNTTLPAPKTFQLKASEQCCNFDKKKQPLTIKILEPITNKHLNNVAIYYSKNKYLLQTYKLNKWSDYPVKMILEVLSAKLDDINIYDNIITSHIYSQPDYILQSELLSFQQNISNSKSEINVKMKFYLTQNNNTKHIISKTFNYTISCKNIDAYSAVEAFNEAIDLLTNDMSLWLYENTKEK